MGAMVINAASTGYREDGPTSFYMGHLLEYHSDVTYNGSHSQPAGVWMGRYFGSIYTLSGSTGTQFGPVQEDGSFTYTMSVDTLTIYQTVYDPVAGAIVTGPVMGTATIPAFTYSGTGSSYDSDGDGSYDSFDLYVNDVVDGLYPFGAHLAAHDLEFNGSAVDDYIDGSYLSGGDRTASFFGGGGSDVIHGSMAANNTIFGGAGEDFLYVNANSYGALGGVMFHSASTNFIDGGSENDYIDFNGEADDTAMLHGGAGDDQIWSQGGQGILWGGAGNDSLNSDHTEDMAAFTGSHTEYVFTPIGYNAFEVADLRSGSPDGTDSVYGIRLFQFSTGRYDISQLLADRAQVVMPSTSYVAPDDASYEVTGTSRADSITMQGGADLVRGLAGNDTILTGGGEDIIEVSGGTAGEDRIDGGAGINDILRAMASNTLIRLASITGVEEITANGFTGVEILGTRAADSFDFSGATLTGITAIDLGGGNDTFQGSAGADRVLGGAGSDALSGNGGADDFVYTSTANSVGKAVDRILDFAQGDDRIDLSAIDANTQRGASGNQTFSFIGTGGFTKTAGELRYDPSNFVGQTRLYGDVNGDGKADMEIRLDGTLLLTADDFLL